MVQESHFGIFSTEMFFSTEMQLYMRMFLAVYYMIIIITAITTQEVI